MDKFMKFMLKTSKKRSRSDAKEKEKEEEEKHKTPKDNGYIAVVDSIEYKQLLQERDNLLEDRQLTLLEQAELCKWEHEFKQHPTIQPFLPLNTEHPRAREILVAMLLLALEKANVTTNALSQANEVLVGELNGVKEQMKLLERTIEILKPIQDILNENKELTALIFKLNGEKEAISTKLKETERKLAVNTMEVSLRLREEKEVAWKKVTKQLEGLHHEILDQLNLDDYQAGKFDNYDKFIEFLEKVRMIWNGY